jgi:hypothetical protein
VEIQTYGRIRYALSTRVRERKVIDVLLSRPLKAYWEGEEVTSVESDLLAMAAYAGCLSRENAFVVLPSFFLYLAFACIAI